MPAPRTPLVAVDIIIELTHRRQPSVVLIERKNPPPGWALPGGFVEIGESLEAAAIREAAEETTLQVTLRTLLGVYSDPKRDPRGHTVSAVYIASAQGEPRGMDDARDARVFELDALPEALAFDHHTILSDYHAYLQSGKPPALRSPI